jgi:transposase
MKTLTITNEQINDIPLVVGIIEGMGIRKVVDTYVKLHGNWQGISVGTLVTIWLCYMLTEQDHRLVTVREWVAARQQMFNALLGIELRDTDCTDDRLANALTMLGDEQVQAQLDQALVQQWISVYELPVDTIRLDSTSVSVYHAGEHPDSLLQPGHSKDHRPDLNQFKVMLATLDPLGLPLTVQVEGGQRADDPLYVPAYEHASATVGTREVLVVGDSKMGALGTRGHLVNEGSYYLCAYRPPGSTAEREGWVEAALERSADWQVIQLADDRTGEVATVAVIDEWEREQSWVDELTGEGVTWTERVLVVRSSAMQAGLERKRERTLDRICAQLDRLAMPPQRGRRRYRNRADLVAKVAEMLSPPDFSDMLQVELAEEVEADGTSRWIVAGYQVDDAAWQAMVARLGWQVYVTNSTVAQYDAPALVWCYRHQTILEHGFARLKTRRLHIRPVFLRDEQRIVGLTWLLTLALRVLTLTEYRLRCALAQRSEEVVGLNPASRTQGTRRPTTERVLRAFRDITLTWVDTGHAAQVHVTPLTSTQCHILSLLQLPPDLYARLATAKPKAPGNQGEKEMSVSNSK